jgi:hypothetical protein
MRFRKLYLHKANVISALKKMVDFENQLLLLYKDFNLDLRDNTGRRNMLLSQAQESFFSDEISSLGYDVVHLGKTGEPDIVIKCIGKEVECKLTSAGNSSWPLQCDYATLSRKGSSDFLYVLSDRNFSKFAVLLFENLSVEDFHLPAPGSRQKSRMNKASAMKKCRILHGKVSDKSKFYYTKYSNDLQIENQKMTNRFQELETRIKNASTENKKNCAQRILKNERMRFLKKEANLMEKISYWSHSHPRYEISLLQLD